VTPLQGKTSWWTTVARSLVSAKRCWIF